MEKEENQSPRTRRGIIAVLICVLAIILAFVIYGIVSCTMPALTKFRLLEAGYSSESKLYEVKIEVKVNDSDIEIDAQDFALFVYGAPRGASSFVSGKSTFRFYKPEDTGKLVLYIAFDADEVFVDKPIRMTYKGKTIIK